MTQELLGAARIPLPGDMIISWDRRLDILERRLDGSVYDDAFSVQGISGLTYTVEGRVLNTTMGKHQYWVQKETNTLATEHLP